MGNVNEKTNSFYFIEVSYITFQISKIVNYCQKWIN